MDVIQGAPVSDPYRGLENPDDPAVKGWSKAQNARTRAYLDALPGRAVLSAKIRRLLTDRSALAVGLQARGGKVFTTYVDPAAQQPSLVTLM